MSWWYGTIILCTFILRTIVRSPKLTIQYSFRYITLPTIVESILIQMLLTWIFMQIRKR